MNLKNIPLLIVLFIFSFACKKETKYNQSENKIMLLLNKTDTIYFDSNLNGVYNNWNNIFYTKDLTKDFTIIMSDTLKFPSIFISFNGRTTGQFIQTSDKCFIRYVDINTQVFTSVLGNFDLKVNTYGDVGDQIIGEFKGVLKMINLKKSILISKGSFSVERKPDFPKL